MAFRAGAVAAAAPALLTATDALCVRGWLRGSVCFDGIRTAVLADSRCASAKAGLNAGCSIIPGCASVDC
jgi:hypothetical protein